MQNIKTLRYSLISGWFIVGLAIILVGTLLIPENERSDYFWLKVFWTQVLNLLFWASMTFYIFVSIDQKDSVTRFGAITPSMTIVTALYAVISFLVMVTHAFIPQIRFANRVHLIIQIILFVIVALSVVFLLASRVTGTSGHGFDRTNTLSPKDLHDLLAAHESLLHNSAAQILKERIKQLRETQIYSLHECASLAERSDYHELARKTEELCKSILELSSMSGNQEEKLQILNESTLTLIAKTNLISAKQVKR